jgi:hypothetical protein
MVKNVRKNKKFAPDERVDRVKKLPVVPVEVLATVSVLFYVITGMLFWKTSGCLQYFLFWTAVITFWAFSFKFAARKMCQYQATPLFVLEKRLFCFNAVLRLPRGKNVPDAGTSLLQARKELKSLLCELQKSRQIRLVVVTWLIEPKWPKHFPIPPHETRLIHPLPALPKRLGAHLAWKKRKKDIKTAKHRDPWRSRWYRFVWNFRGPNDVKTKKAGPKPRRIKE